MSALAVIENSTRRPSLIVACTPLFPPQAPPQQHEATEKEEQTRRVIQDDVEGNNSRVAAVAARPENENEDDDDDDEFSHIITEGLPPEIAQVALELASQVAALGKHLTEQDVEEASHRNDPLYREFLKAGAKPNASSGEMMISLGQFHRHLRSRKLTSTEKLQAIVDEFSPVRNSTGGVGAGTGAGDDSNSGFHHIDRFRKMQLQKQMNNVIGAGSGSGSGVAAAANRKSYSAAGGRDYNGPAYSSSSVENYYNITDDSSGQSNSNRSALSEMDKEMILMGSCFLNFNQVSALIRHHTGGPQKRVRATTFSSRLVEGSANNHNGNNNNNNNNISNSGRQQHCESVGANSVLNRSTSSSTKSGLYYSAQASYQNFARNPSEVFSSTSVGSISGTVDEQQTSSHFLLHHHHHHHHQRRSSVSANSIKNADVQQQQESEPETPRALPVGASTVPVVSNTSSRQLQQPLPTVSPPPPPPLTSIPLQASLEKTKSSINLATSNTNNNNNNNNNNILCNDTPKKSAKADRLKIYGDSNIAKEENGDDYEDEVDEEEDEVDDNGENEFFATGNERKTPHSTRQNRLFAKIERISQSPQRVHGGRSSDSVVPTYLLPTKQLKAKMRKEKEMTAERNRQEMLYFQKQQQQQYELQSGAFTSASFCSQSQQQQQQQQLQNEFDHHQQHEGQPSAEQVPSYASFGSDDVSNSTNKDNAAINDNNSTGNLNPPRDSYNYTFESSPLPPPAPSASCFPPPVKPGYGFLEGNSRFKAKVEGRRRVPDRPTFSPRSHRSSSPQERYDAFLAYQKHHHHLQSPSHPHRNNNNNNNNNIVADNVAKNQQERHQATSSEAKNPRSIRFLQKLEQEKKEKKREEAERRKRQADAQPASFAYYKWMQSNGRSLPVSASEAGFPPATQSQKSTDSSATATTADGPVFSSSSYYHHREHVQDFVQGEGQQHQQQRPQSAACTRNKANSRPLSGLSDASTSTSSMSSSRFVQPPSRPISASNNNTRIKTGSRPSSARILVSGNSNNNNNNTNYNNNSNNNNNNLAHHTPSTISFHDQDIPSMILIPEQHDFVFAKLAPGGPSYLVRPDYHQQRRQKQDHQHYHQHQQSTTLPNGRKKTTTFDEMKEYFVDDDDNDDGGEDKEKENNFNRVATNDDDDDDNDVERFFQSRKPSRTENTQRRRFEQENEVRRQEAEKDDEGEQPSWNTVSSAGLSNSYGASFSRSLGNIKKSTTTQITSAAPCEQARVRDDDTTAAGLAKMMRAHVSIRKVQRWYRALYHRRREGAARMLQRFGRGYFSGRLTVSRIPIPLHCDVDVDDEGEVGKVPAASSLPSSKKKTIPRTQLYLERLQRIGRGYIHSRKRLHLQFQTESFDRNIGRFAAFLGLRACFATQRKNESVNNNNSNDNDKNIDSSEDVAPSSTLPNTTRNNKRDPFEGFDDIPIVSVSQQTHEQQNNQQLQQQQRQHQQRQHNHDPDQTRLALNGKLLPSTSFRLATAPSSSFTSAHSSFRQQPLHVPSTSTSSCQKRSSFALSSSNAPAAVAPLERKPEEVRLTYAISAANEKERERQQEQVDGRHRHRAPSASGSSSPFFSRQKKLHQFNEEYEKLIAKEEAEQNKRLDAERKKNLRWHRPERARMPKDDADGVAEIEILSKFI